MALSSTHIYKLIYEDNMNRKRNNLFIKYSYVVAMNKSTYTSNSLEHTLNLTIEGIIILAITLSYLLFFLQVVVDRGG